MDKEKLEQRKRNEKGGALILTLAFVFFTATFSLALSLGAVSEIRAVERFENRIVSFHWAEGAIDRTLVTLRTDSSYPGLPVTGASTGRVSGSYQTTVTYSGTPNIYQIEAVGTIGMNQTSYGFQQSILKAVVNLATTYPFPGALFANSTISMSGNAKTDAYDSRNGPYHPSTATRDGDIGSNAKLAGTIKLSGNARVEGNATVGPGADVSTAITTSGNAVITGTKSAASATTNLPPVTIPAGLTNLGNLSISGNTKMTLGAGTYWYNSISITGNAKLDFTGQAIIYVSGNVKIAGNGIGTANNLPPNLKIYVAGNRTVSITGNGDLYAGIYAPQSALHISGNGQLFGSAVSNTIEHSGNAKIHFDKALAAGNSSSTNQNLLAWIEKY